MTFSHAPFLRPFPRYDPYALIKQGSEVFLHPRGGKPEYTPPSDPPSDEESTLIGCLEVLIGYKPEYTPPSDPSSDEDGRDGESCTM